MKRQLGEREYVVREKDFKIVSESWNKYMIKETGEQVRIKLVVKKIERALNDDGSLAYSADGEPLVFLHWSQPIIVASAPEDEEGVGG